MVPKFRVYETDRKAMHYTDKDLVVCFSDNGVDVIDHTTFSSSCMDIDNFVLMQSTGLKDKNGLEIFEGDVLKVFIFDGKGPHAKVIFKNGMFGIEDDMFGYGYDKGLYTLDQIISIRDAEVIGNIYEHPHLLESNNE